MNNILLLFTLFVIGILLVSGAFEGFDLRAYTRGRTYESGANMLRGDLPIYPTRQSWFNSRYGPSGLVRGFF